MNDHVAKLPALDIAVSLMKNAVALLDHAGASDAAAALQGAIDIACEEPTLENS
ncbi:MULTISPECIES: hypothetical protein [unclassified Sphingomonas]|uniref:hypothetical protein n=1 Tax=unclassified Sphingomonas TaxID=196159 RepID=UPI00226AB352|nr:MULTISPECIES: hypothetical protein [unclassified Sphingomonas]